MKAIVRIGLRVTIVALLLAAILDLPIPAGRGPRVRVYAIDASGSAGSFGARDGLRVAEDDRRALGPSGRVALLAFGARPIAGAEPFDGPLPSVERGATDLGAAIEAAVGLAAPHGEVVLATDGRDTEGGLERALLRAAALGVPVHVLPTGADPGTDVRIAAVDAPAVAAPGARFDVRVTLESSGPARGTLNGVPFEFAAAARQDIVLRGPAPTLRLDVEDACPENNVAELTVLARTDAPRVLAPPYLARAFPASWTVEQGGPPETFDAIIIDRLEPGAAQAARDSGVGLIVLGGSRSYALGGFQRTPIEEVLPLWAFPEERSTVVFVLDRSGSMSAEVPPTGRRRIDIAAGAVASAIGLLHGDDRWAIVAFSGDVETVVPLRQGAGLLPALSPGGPTRLVPALTQALAVAESAPSGRIRIVLVTDGETQEADADLESLGRRLASRGAQLTVFATGAGPGGKLPRLGGTLVGAADLTRLADVMRDALARSHGLTVEAATLQAGDDELVAGLGPWPGAGRINRTTAKPGARVLVTSGDAPVLAVGVAGRGRVAAATFSLEEGWSGGLATWPRLPDLLQRLVAHVSPPAPGVASASARLEAGHVVFSVRRAGDAEAIDATPVRLLRRGRDLYEGRVPARPGTTVLRIAGRAVAAFTLPHPPEYAALGPDGDALARIATVTGGRVLAGAADLRRLPHRGPPGRRAGRPLFLAGALAAFLIEIALATFWR